MRIIENLVSRTVTPYEYAMGIARMIQRIKANEELNGVQPATTVMSQVAERLGVTSRTVYKNQAISNLIPQLGQLLNDKVISQFAAYQLGQLPALSEMS